MSNNKQSSSVEWLMDKLFDPSSMVKEQLEWFEQAKAMHKEEIMDAHIEGQRVFDKFPHTQWTNNQAEQYYNETFKTKEK